MIVEFAGCTGAGKTTLAREVHRRLAKHGPVTTSYELAAGPVGLGQATNPTLRNLVQDLVGLPFFLGGLVRHRAFVGYALKALGRQSSSLFLTANYVRSIARKIGMYEIGRRSPQDRIILVDEGTVLSAHLLFVFGRHEPSQEEIEAFASLVPLPDLVICVEAPLECLVQRSLQRSDAPREMKAKDEPEVEAYLKCAAGLFDRLTRTGPIRDRVLVASNPTAAEDERHKLAEWIAAFILNYEPSGGRVATRPAGRIEPVSAIGDKGVS
jgi:thymidylate kinase